MNIGEPHYTREISEVNLKEAFPIRRESIYAQIEEGKKELAGRGAKQSRRPAKVRRASGRTNPSTKKEQSLRDLLRFDSGCRLRCAYRCTLD